MAGIALVNMGMAITDTPMMGWIGPTALAAGAVVSDLYSLVFYLAAGTLSAVAVLAARAAFGALHSGWAPSTSTLAVLNAAGAGAAASEASGRVLGEGLGQRYSSAARIALYAALAAWPKAALQVRRLGALGLRFVSDLSAARLRFGLALPCLVSSAAALPGIGAILELLDPRAGMAALGVVCRSVRWDLRAGRPSPPRPGRRSRIPLRSRRRVTASRIAVVVDNEDVRDMRHHPSPTPDLRCAPGDLSRRVAGCLRHTDTDHRRSGTVLRR
jgi:hypothetical protein